MTQKKKIANILVRVTSVIVLVLCTLGLTGVLDIKKTNPITILLVGVLNVINGVVGYEDNRKAKRLLIGSGIFCIFVVAFTTFVH